MNSVSWFIYIAQVSGSIGAMFGAMSIMVGIGLALYSIIATVCASVDANEFKPDIPRTRFFALIIAFGLIAAVFPDKNTLYAIAASQVGEKIATSETAKGMADDATKALQQWIKRQIEPEAKEKR